jgi:hypothetical protein
MNAARIAFVLLATGLTWAAPAPAQDAAVEVRVERIKPGKERLATLRFLKENRDFIRARFDLLRERTLEVRAGAESVDPRFLAYREMLAAAMAGADSAAALAERQERTRLLASIRELGDLEDRLDRLEDLLDGQFVRLAEIEADFTGRQRTELIVLVRGTPSPSAGEIVIAVEGAPLQRVSIDPAQQAALADGGVMQVFHAAVEPREQTLELTLGGDAWAAAPAGWLTLTPERDRLTLLEIDLSGAAPADGGAGVRARAWRHVPVPPSVDG